MSKAPVHAPDLTFFFKPQQLTRIKQWVLLDDLTPGHLRELLNVRHDLFYQLLYGKELNVQGNIGEGETDFGKLWVIIPNRIIVLLPAYGSPFSQRELCGLFIPDPQGGFTILNFFMDDVVVRSLHIGATGPKHYPKLHEKGFGATITIAQEHSPEESKVYAIRTDRYHELQTSMEKFGT